MPSLSVDAILFDMDGTLVDESESYREVIRLTAEFILSEQVTAEEVETVKRVPGLNQDWDATWALIEWRLHGAILVPGRADRASHPYQHLRNVFQTYYLGDRIWRDLSGSEPPFLWNDPLIEREKSLISAATLDWLGAFLTGIVTARPRAEALMALEQHHLEPVCGPETLLAMEDSPYHKPDPGALLELARRLNCCAGVYVGDTINDALAALAAGMAFVHVGRMPFTDPDVERRITCRIASVDDLPAICRPLPTTQDVGS